MSEDCARCYHALGEGTLLACGRCARRYHETCWLPGCVQDACTNEYDYQVRLPGVERFESLSASLQRRQPSSRFPKTSPPVPTASCRPTPSAPVLATCRLSPLQQGFAWGVRDFRWDLLWAGAGLGFVASKGALPFLLLAVTSVLAQLIHLWRAEFEILLERDHLVIATLEGAVLERLPRAVLSYTSRGLTWRSWGRNVRVTLNGSTPNAGERLARWLRGATSVPARVRVLERGEGLRCPLCRDRLARLEGHCSGCGAHYHVSCWDELGGCALPSCRALTVSGGVHPRADTHLVRGAGAT